MVKERFTSIVEIYSLANSKMVSSLKERSMSCKRIKPTHSSKSNMMITVKRLRKKKLAEDINLYEIFIDVRLYFIII